ncbi:lysylphosphatidylglycerol synthase transmembrane domain-containing protein [Silvibacterium sp.]|uniref:lysylphosphatidylglycerol synthase transmembrane domain-containing protein n=1 Tax=Silvibacterium sp. TaxID=1964179 RepID=UPI0039E27DEF
MKNKRWILFAVLAVVLGVLAYAFRDRMHFDWHNFGEQLKLADWRRIGIGIALIWLAYGVRAVRWSLFLKPTKKVSPLKLVGSQVIGFTAVALFGRLADLVRPYLVSKRTQLPLSSQVGVYTVERMFDFGCLALIFSVVLLFSPDRANLPRPDLIHKAALGGLLGTFALAIFAILARVAGKVVAAVVGKGLGMFSKSLGESASEKILDFRDGLNVISSLGDFLAIFGVSIIHWLMIIYAYLETTRAFVATPQLATMTLAKCMLLMAWSMGSSMLQLPIVGWFTQIAFTAMGLKAIFNVAPEPAVGCGAVLLIVTFMSVIPLGLVWAQVEHVSLKEISEESEKVGVESLTAPVQEAAE